MIGWLVVMLFIFFFLMVAMISLVRADSFSNIVTSALITLFIFLAIFAVTYFYQRWYFAVYFYDLTDSFIIIKKGVVTPREISIPYERVQDVYVDQDIFDRIFSLYDVHLSSATVSSGYEAHIDGLEHTAAMGLREILLKIVSEKISRKSTNPAADSQNLNG